VNAAARHGFSKIAIDLPLRERVPLLLYGVLLFLAGIAIYIVLVPAGMLLDRMPDAPHAIPRALLLLSVTLVWAGIIAGAVDLFLLLPFKRRQRRVDYMGFDNRKVTVVLTAYNDELSIGKAVRDFSSHPLVQRVLVIDNNSSDGTGRVAAEAGAEVVREPKQGYGHCVFRALTEGVSFRDTLFTLLCEGDMTFRAYDIDKFLSFAPHADIVNGTRIVEQLRSRDTQLTTFMYYGNFFVGKLLETKHIGQGTYTDVGTTYKLCWNSALERLLPLLNPDINLEFNAHFLDLAIRNRFRVVECPVTFHSRVGRSKGGNASDLRALKVGMRMVRGILLGWPKARSAS